MASAFHNLSHKHADELSFELFDRGYRIVSDTGLYNKDQNRFYDYPALRPGSQHGDGRRQGLRAQAPQCLWKRDRCPLASGRTGWYGIRATNPLVKRQGVSHERLFFYKPGTALVVVDRRRRQEASTFTTGGSSSGQTCRSARAGRAGARSRGLPGSSLRRPRHTPSADRTTVRGDRDTLEGYTFPKLPQEAAALDRRLSLAREERDPRDHVQP